MTQEFSGIAPEAIEELQRLKERDGVLLTTAVVEAAEDEGSPLHGFFTWDNTQAAEQYRLTEARRLIQHVVVRIEGSETRVRAFVNLAAGDGQAYYATADVAADPRLADQLRHLLRLDIQRWQRRLADFEEFAEASSRLESLAAVV